MRGLARVAVTSVVALAFTLAGGPARAGEPRTHDGFFLRLSAGAGSAKTGIEVFGLDTDLKGTSGDLNIAVGAMIARNLALHGTLFGWAIQGPDLTFEGETEQEDDGVVAMSAWGGGLTYYFMPVNLYVSGTLGVGSLVFETDDIDEDSGSDLVGEITLGKEWWVGDSWGLGIAASYGVHSLPAPDLFDEDWFGNSWAIRFSATRN
ncbi:MAG TPA: hypothetical protein VFP58_02975 [Candidatus Eisenbacteria bacterium]|nr:hypothetical protein [Candidatus Eisenbacteria bacterium]